MANLTPEEIVSASREIYATELQAQLEPARKGEFVAIEPVSKEYFLGKTPSEAAQAARAKHPNRLSCILRVGAYPVIRIDAWG